ncbi:MAG TPA: ATP-binding protein [Azospirillum sp.]|nr:ATP-binding protein [Azospirillum sp.]
MKWETSLSALAAAAALPVVLFAAVMVFLYGSERAAVVEHDLRSKASAAATAVERQIASEFGVLNALATSEALDNPDLNAFQAQAQRALATRPAWFGITLTDHDRQLMNTRIPSGSPLPSVIDTDSLNRTLATATPRVGSVQRAPERYPEPFVLVRVPVMRNGVVRFTLTAALRAYALTELLREQGDPKDWRIAIMDQSGNLLARTSSRDPMDSEVGTPPRPLVQAGVAKGRDGIFEAVSSDGFRSTGAFVHSGLTGWTIIAGTSTDAVLWASRRSVLIAAAGGVVAALLAGALGWGQIRAHRRRRLAEQMMAEVKTERAVADRLSDIATHFPGVIYRRVLKNGAISYPYVSDPHHFFPDLNRSHFDSTVLHETAGARMTPEARARWQQALDASAETGAPYSVELEVVKPDGKRHLLRSLAHTRREADGSVVWDGLILDVTAQRDAETRSRVADERLRLAVSAADLGTFDLDIRSRHLTWSERCKAMFGLPPDAEVSGRVYLSRVHPDDIQLVRDAERGAFDPASSGEYHARFRARWPDGTIRWLEAMGKVIFVDDDGTRRPVRLIGTVMDVTEERNAEQALKDARDRAERANLSKSKFLAAASHDLRQPLQSLFMFSATLHRYVDHGPGREQLMHLERGLDALKGLLDSLLDVSRLDAGIIQPEIEEFPVDDLLEQVVASYAPVASGKGLTLDVRACGGAVRSDRNLLGRMFRNLVENAIRYTERGGVRLSCRANGDTLLIEVADTGIGIPPDHLDRIWEEFHQVGNPERDRSKGMGLGLAIVQRLSNLLNHPVEVRSAPGRGSVFTIAVPATQALPSPESRAVAAVESSHGRFAVVVDDDAIVLLGLKAMFEEWGYRVLVAGSADDALARLDGTDRRPDIIVADYRLREQRVGTEVILRIRHRYGTAIPGIILTGETGPEAQRDAAMHGLRVIHKPVTPRQLAQALERQQSMAG